MVPLVCRTRSSSDPWNNSDSKSIMRILPVGSLPLLIGRQQHWGQYLYGEVLSLALALVVASFVCLLISFHHCFVFISLSSAVVVVVRVIYSLESAYLTPIILVPDPGHGRSKRGACGQCPGSIPRKAFLPSLQLLQVYVHVSVLVLSFALLITFEFAFAFRSSLAAFRVCNFLRNGDDRLCEAGVDTDIDGDEEGDSHSPSTP